MKVLFIQNVASRFNTFAYSSYLAANDLGIEFHIASAWTGYRDDDAIRYDENKYGIKIFQVDFVRTPYNLKNIRAYRQIVEIIEREKYDIIHCNTPIGGVIGRLAGSKCNISKIIYQAHGFHFYKGAPIKNWLIFYPIERLLAHLSDAIITINQEDYIRAQSFKLKNKGKIYIVPGVGIDTSIFTGLISNVDIKRKELNIPSNSKVLISIGELNQNKNNIVIIDALKRINDSNIHYILCGKGPLEEKLKVKAMPIIDNVHFLGYREDINELLHISDIFVLPSYREGLSRSLMEAMASNLPCIVSNIRGNNDLITENYGGRLINPNSVDGWSKAIFELANNSEMMKMYGHFNRKKVESFSLHNAVESIKEVYRSVIDK